MTNNTTSAVALSSLQLSVFPLHIWSPFKRLLCVTLQYSSFLCTGSPDSTYLVMD